MCVYRRGDDGCAWCMSLDGSSVINHWLALALYEVKGEPSVALALAADAARLRLLFATPLTIGEPCLCLVSPSSPLTPPNHQSMLKASTETFSLAMQRRINMPFDYLSPESGYTLLGGPITPSIPRLEMPTRRSKLKCNQIYSD